MVLSTSTPLLSFGCHLSLSVFSRVRCNIHLQSANEPVLQPPESDRTEFGVQHFIWQDAWSQQVLRRYDIQNIVFNLIIDEVGESIMGSQLYTVQGIAGSSSHLTAKVDGVLGWSFASGMGARNQVRPTSSWVHHPDFHMKSPIHRHIVSANSILQTSRWRLVTRLE